jgi:hypothetical protein
MSKATMLTIIPPPPPPCLQSFGRPYGAVGPLCRQGNTKILTHDFTHRLHMEVFGMEYYPPELTDWWMDDWIARVYGSSRTRQSKSIEVRRLMYF